MLVDTIELRFPAVGQFAGPEGRRTHYLDLAADPGETLPPIMFLHGASGNLNDPRGAFQPALQGQARLIFIDRPGHGYSDRGGAENPAEQAERYKELIDELGIDKVILVGHSLGSASVAAFAVLHPERVAGLIFVAPATHSWPGGVTWYYDVGALPVIGNMFTETVLMPVGLRSVEAGAKTVFEPQSAPDGYVATAAIPLALRPAAFRANSRDVAGLNSFVKDFSPRYKEIKAPTVIITGDIDDIVAPSIHSVGLERDIAGAELIVLPGVGHKPDYVAVQTVVDAIRKVSQPPG